MRFKASFINQLPAYWRWGVLVVWVVCAVLAQPTALSPECVLGGQRGFSTAQQNCSYSSHITSVHTVLSAEACSALLTPHPPLIRASQGKCQLSFSAPQKVTSCGRKQQNMSSGNTQVRSKEKGLAEGLFRKLGLARGVLWPVVKFLSSLEHWSCNVKWDVLCLCNAQSWILFPDVPSIVLPVCVAVRKAYWSWEATMFTW